MFNNLLYITRALYKYIGIKLPLAMCISMIAAIFEILALVLLAPLLEALLKSREYIELGDNLFLDILRNFLPLESAIHIQIAALIFAISISIKSFATFVNFSFFASSIEHITTNMRDMMLKCLSSLKFSRFTQLNFGEFVNLFNEQVNIAGDGYNNAFLVYNKVITSSIYFTSVLLISWQATIVAAVFSLPTIFIFRYTSKRISYYSHKSVDYSSKTQSTIIDFGKSYKYLKSIHKLENFENQLRQLSCMTEKFKRKSYLLKGLTVSLRDPISISILLVTVFAAVRLSLTENTYLALIIVSYKLLQSINSLQQNIQNLNLYIGPIKKINNFLTSNKGENEVVGIISDIYAIESIEFENVSLQLNSIKILENINVKFESGKKYGIIGKSGSGKSTIIDLITMLYSPTSGSIVINGIKSNSIDSGIWRKNIGFVPQSPYIYNSSIIENLYYGFFNLNPKEKNLIFEQIKSLTIQTGIYNFIMNSPAKFDSKVGEGGLQLSGGQAQRIALTRELIRNPKILILDEATSALDPISENYVHSTIASLDKSITVFIVSHKMSTLSYCDQILIVNSGKLKRNLSYSELMSDDGMLNYY